MRADEKLTAFLELETAIRPTSTELHFLTKPALATQFAPQASQADQSAAEQRNCRAAIRDTRDTHRPDLEREVLVLLPNAPHATLPRAHARERAGTPT
jgi:hypothetical protein